LKLSAREGISRSEADANGLSRHRVRSIGGHLLLTLALLAACQEIALRLVFPLPEVLNFDRLAYSPQRVQSTAPSATLGHVSFVWSSEPDGVEFVHRLNLYGFRDHTWSLRPEPGVTRVAFVGDSFVEGFMAPGDSTIPRGFEAAANGDGIALETINLGIGGTSLPTYARLIRDATPLFRPAWVFVVVYANDLGTKPLDFAGFEEALVPLYSRPWRPRLLYVLDRLREHGTVPRRWTESPYPFIPPVPDPRNRFSRKGIAARSAKFVKPEIADAMRRGKFNPALASLAEVLDRQLRRKRDATPELRWADDYTDRHGARLAVVYIPAKHQVSDRYLPYLAEYSPRHKVHSFRGRIYQRQAAQLSATCRELDLPFLDLSPMLSRLEGEGQEMYWDYDGHMRPEGYLRVGEEIFHWWRQLHGEPGDI